MHHFNLTELLATGKVLITALQSLNIRFDSNPETLIELSFSSELPNTYLSVKSLLCFYCWSKSANIFTLAYWIFCDICEKGKNKQNGFQYRNPPGFVFNLKPFLLQMGCTEIWQKMLSATLHIHQNVCAVLGRKAASCSSGCARGKNAVWYFPRCLDVPDSHSGHISVRSCGVEEEERFAQMLAWSRVF